MVGSLNPLSHTNKTNEMMARFSARPMALQLSAFMAVRSSINPDKAEGLSVARENPRCPECGRRTTYRTGTNGTFWQCEGECGWTENVGKTKAAARLQRAPMSANPTFATKAAELRQDEMARLSAAVTPRIETFRAMTCDMLRVEVAAMLDRLGHHVVSSTGYIVSEKGSQKFIIACAVPTDTTPTGIAAVRRLRDAVVANSAARGFYITPRSFAPEAIHYAASAPLDLVDGPLLIKSMHKSRKGMNVPTSYRAMCALCGAIVQHDLNKKQAILCANATPSRPRLPGPPLCRTARRSSRTGSRREPSPPTPEGPQIPNPTSEKEQRRTIWRRLPTGYSGVPADTIASASFENYLAQVLSVARSPVRGWGSFVIKSVIKNKLSE